MVAGQSDLKGLRRMAAELGDEMTPHLKEFIETDWTAEELTDAVMMRKHVSNMMWRFMRNYDLLLTPTLTVPAFEVGIQGPTMTDGREVDQFEWLHFTYPMNLTGQPAASVPAGFTDDGLPVGLQIVGPHLGDSIVLRAAACFEAARPWADKWPPLLDEMGL
jgi:aspartyl-tRNA(Asn)/glutamyl-tRNA(Gln) amidotransferase subunit A